MITASSAQSRNPSLPITFGIHSHLATRTRKRPERLQTDMHQMPINCLDLMVIQLQSDQLPILLVINEQFCQRRRRIILTSPQTQPDITQSCSLLNAQTILGQCLQDW